MKTKEKDRSKKLDNAFKKINTGLTDSELEEALDTIERYGTLHNYKKRKPLPTPPIQSSPKHK